MERQNRKLRFAEDHQTFVLLEGPSTATKAAKTKRPREDPRKAARGDAYKLIPKGYGHLLEGCFENPLEDCTQKQENINAFVAGIPDRDNARGLERYMCPQHRDERDDAREDVVEAVLRQQRQLARRRKSSVASDDDDKWDKLRAASRKHSRISKAFARRVGLADELAVQEDQEEDARLFEASTAPVSSLASSVPGETTTPASSSSPMTLCNAQKALLRLPFRQPSARQLNTGIRSMAASMNAKKASRQASMRKLNCSIRNLASSLVSTCSNHTISSKQMHSFSESSSSSSSSAVPLPSELGYIHHPSLITMSSRSRDRALKLPGRSSITKASDCADLLQSALDFVDDGDDGNDDDCTTTSKDNKRTSMCPCDDGCRNSPPLALSA